MSRALGGRSLTTRSPMLIVPPDDILEPGDHAQQRGLAAAGGADQHDELRRRQYRCQTPWSTSMAAIGLRAAAMVDRGHQCAPSMSRAGADT